MDTAPAPEAPRSAPRLLMDLRPALGEHAGIPQETRLLFRALRMLPGLEVEGLIQHHSHALQPGLPAHTGRSDSLPPDQRINRLARVVISIERKFLRSYLSVVPVVVRRLTGLRESLPRFEPAGYGDFIWRRLFAKSLPPADFERVTSAPYRILRAPWVSMQICGLLTRKLALPLFPRLDTRGYAVLVAECPFPAVVAAETRLVVRYHDAIPLFMPHTISEARFHQSFHYHALRSNVAQGAWFACVSDATRRDLVRVFPQAEARSVTIPNMVSHDYFEEESAPEQVAEIVRVRRVGAAARRKETTPAGPLRYLLMVATIEPRKNHLTLLHAWERLRTGLYPDLHLVVVGQPGWKHKPITRRLMAWAERGDVVMLRNLPAPELRTLYRHAMATVCPSVGEGFDFPGIEAMACGGAVVASDIPVHREVFRDAAHYFDTYSVDDLSRAIGEVIGPEGTQRREELVRLGATVARLYHPDQILPSWGRFFEQIGLATRSAT